MKHPRTLASLAAVLAALALSPGVAAGPGDSATAQALFDRGIELMKEGKYADACPKLEESQRLDPGLGTLFQLAVCLEGQGRTASAWAKYLEVEGQARSSGQGQRADYARDKAAALEPKLVRLSVEVPTRTAGLEVYVGGVLLREATWGLPLPVDPGIVKLEARAAGFKPWQREVTVGAQRIMTVSIPVLEPEATVAPPVATAPPPATAAAPSPGVPAAPSPGAPAPSPAPEVDSGGGSTLPGWLLVGLGAAGLVVGGVTGMMAISEKSKLDSGCPDGECPPELHDEHATFNQYRTFSTIGFVVGGVGLGGGLILLATAGGSDSPARSGATFTLRGRF